jgi:hypothetical protein
MYWILRQCCGSGSAFILISWIRILDQEGKNDPERWRKFHLLKFRMLSFEGFDSSPVALVLHGGMGKNKWKVFWFLFK